VKLHSSESPPAPIPSPSPPQNENQKALQKQQRIREDVQTKLFTPAAPRPSPDGGGENDEIDPGGTGRTTGQGALPHTEHEEEVLTPMD